MKGKKLHLNATAKTRAGGLSTMTAGLPRGTHSKKYCPTTAAPKPGIRAGNVKHT